MLTVDTDQIKIDVTTLMNNYNELSIEIDNQQTQLDTLEGAYSSNTDAAIKLENRLTKLEGDAVTIRADVNVLQTDTTNIEVDVTKIQNQEKDLSVQVTEIQS